MLALVPGGGHLGKGPAVGAAILEVKPAPSREGTKLLPSVTGFILSATTLLNPLPKSIPYGLFSVSLAFIVHCPCVCLRARAFSLRRL